MLKKEFISETLAEIAKQFPIKKISYFGSYAEGNATPESDLDVLVEFNEDYVSLFLLVELKNSLEEALGIKVDLIHAPIPKDSVIKINKAVTVYAI